MELVYRTFLYNFKIKFDKIQPLLKIYKYLMSKIKNKLIRKKLPK